MIEIEFLGTGTSTGVPTLQCDCEVCRSADPLDKRLRTSAIVRYRGMSLLIDCGPDFRQQMLRASNSHLDAALLTHIHFDHVAGIDDLRAYSMKRRFPIYARQDVIDHLHRQIPYVFDGPHETWVPNLEFIPVEDNVPFVIGGIEVLPIPVMHGRMLILGYRIGDLAYITDCKEIAPQEVDRLSGVKLLVINALHWKGHVSHQSVDDALKIVDKVKPVRTLFIHMSHEIGFHNQANSKLPAAVEFAHDGQIVRYGE